MSSAKNNILKKIRLALANPTPIPFPDTDTATPVFQPLQQDIVVEFAEQFTQLLGNFSICTNEQELSTQLQILYQQQEWTKIFCSESKFRKLIPASIWTDDVTTCDAAITGCESLVARTGSIVLSATENGRIPSVYAPVHICIAQASQLVYENNDVLIKLQQKYQNNLPSLITFATGPSRTADIEKTLVVGVHGPKEVYCFLIDDLQHES
ncbi:MAG: LUD domain-containing protein [Chitinophagaceae bacterium]|nr:LUD domain-containing protein [Chitinophagaceae bacterium]